MSAEITVVVPYYNEMQTIVSTLEQIAKQTIPASRAIFINSSSTDETSDIVDAWIKDNKHTYPTFFENIFEKTSNPGSSKNIGVQHSDSEWIAFMDCGLKFEVDWLEAQYSYAKKNNIDVAFGVVYLTGKNWVDRCAVSQTYGYKVSRPCVPSTLVRKSVFDKTGLFLIGRRSGYDMAWRLKLNKIGIKTAINENIKVIYSEGNFATTVTQLFKKSILYARPALGLDGYHTPYYYMFFVAFVLFIATQSLIVITVILSGYLLSRIFVIPVIKSKGIRFYREYPFEAILGLGVIGFLIDVGKLIGYFLGIKDLLIKKLNFYNIKKI